MRTDRLHGSENRRSGRDVMTTTTKANGDAAYAVDDRAPLLVVSADMHVRPRPEELRPYCPKQNLEQWDEFPGVVVEQYNRAIEIRSFSDEYWEGRRRNQAT